MIRDKFKFLLVSMYLMIMEKCSSKKEQHDPDYEYYSVILIREQPIIEPLIKKLPESIYHNARFHTKNNAWEVFEKWETDVSLFVPNDPINHVPGDWVLLSEPKDVDNIAKLNSIRNHLLHRPIIIMVT